jgi:hypothetical protein
VICGVPIRRVLIPGLAGALLLSGCSLGETSGTAVISSDRPSIVELSPSTPTTAPTGSASGSVLIPSASPAGSVVTVATPSPTTSPTPSLAAPRLPAVSGFGYATAPKAVVAAFGKTQGTPGVLGPATVRSVVRAQSSIGSVAARTLNPEHAGDTSLQDSLLVGLVKGMSGKGYTTRTRTVSGGKVVVAFRTGSTILAWVHNGLVFQMVSSRDEATTIAYPKAMLAA